MNNDIHASSQLVYLKVSMWQARSLDKRVTNDLNVEQGAAANASRVNKYLMASADAELKAIARIGREARDLVESSTLPWDDAGNRLVSNVALFTLLGELKTVEQKFNIAVDDFVREYPRLCTESITALGDMGNVNDYPAAEEVRGKFGIRVSLQPLADGYGDVRTGLSPEQVSMLNEAYAEQVRGQFEEAQAKAIERLKENVARMADRLSLTPEGKSKAFTYTLVENLRETVDLLRSLNVLNTPELAELLDDAEQRLCRFDVKELRDSLTAASSTKQAADSILARMAAFGSA